MRPLAARRRRRNRTRRNVAARILDSVRRTGRMVYAQEAPGFTSLGSEVAATVAERAFYSLEAPVLRVSGFDTPFPPAKLKATYLPAPHRDPPALYRALPHSPAHTPPPPPTTPSTTTPPPHPP